MLEIVSHKYLKKFVNSHDTDWEHIYSFGRIVSKCLQTKDNYLVNSEIFRTDKWFSALIISLFLNEENSICVMSKEKIEIFKNRHLPILKKFGFNFIENNNEINLENHRILFIPLNKLISKARHSDCINQRIIFTGIENIKEDLKNIFRIYLFKRSWFEGIDSSLVGEHEITNTYNSLKKKLFFISF